MTLPVRQARCAYKCGSVERSSPDLAFFEDQSAGTMDETCAVCRYHRLAHEHVPTRVRPEPLPQCGDHPFTPMVEGREFDTFYCGCRGWD